jgi:methylated-DNA-protein-cysteine methyltransferase-like protein
VRSSNRAHLEALFVRMHEVIRAIPRGRVATYGQVAELAGVPGGARIAAASLKQEAHLPWQRVIGKASGRRGRIKILDPVGAAIQRGLLEKEGVEVGDKGLVDLGVYGWLPKLKTRPPKRARGNQANRATAGSDRGASPRRPPRSGSKRRA